MLNLNATCWVFCVGFNWRGRIISDCRGYWSHSFPLCLCWAPVVPTEGPRSTLFRVGFLGVLDSHPCSSSPRFQRSSMGQSFRSAWGGGVSWTDLLAVCSHWISLPHPHSWGSLWPVVPHWCGHVYVQEGPQLGSLMLLVGPVLNGAVLQFRVSRCLSVWYVRLSILVLVILDPSVLLLLSRLTHLESR